MKKNSQNKKIAIGAVVLLCAVGIYMYAAKYAAMPAPVADIPPIQIQQPAVPAVQPTEVVEGVNYHTLTIATDKPAAELKKIVGEDIVALVLELNRIDMAHIKKGTVLIVPNSFEDTAALSPFPATIAAAADIPKLMLVSQRVQAFGIYEKGTLVRWGGVSTGKKSTQTPSRLYFTNWKGKSVTSSIDDGWILPWYFNLDNTGGVSMHQYELPGYPASHSCVRLFAQDAEWIYNWADQWKLSQDQKTIDVYGTPVIVFGAYGYGKTAPWKNLIKDPQTTTIDSDELEKIISGYIDEIHTKQRPDIEKNPT